jgi:hypothetical protein
MATQHENIEPIGFLHGGVSSPLTFERQVELTSSPEEADTQTHTPEAGYRSQLGGGGGGGEGD